MNSRVTKALLGTYSRRGPLFSVVYLAARGRTPQPRAAAAPACKRALSQETGTHDGRVLSRRAPGLPGAAAAGNMQRADPRRTAPPAPRRAPGCPRRSARSAAGRTRAGAGGGFWGEGGGAPQVHLLACALEPG